VVETLDCHDSKVIVRVASREVEEGPRARSLHITVRDRDKGKGEGGDVDITVPFNAFGMLGNLLGGKWLTFEDSDGDHGKGADADSGFTDVLRRLPPFRLVEVHGDDGTVIVRSE
jgi:hypothetical protein